MPPEVDSLFAEHFGRPPARAEPLAAHGSERRYFRLCGDDRATVVAALNDNAAENRAFFRLTRHFREKGLPVPELLAVAADERSYLVEDLGDTTLFEALKAGRGQFDDAPPAVAALYRQVARELPRFQIGGAQGLDFSVCYPRAAFDRQSMLWDLNYFKYYFLRLARVPFHEQALEDDYQALADLLLRAPSDYFLYRDFQSRNVMIHNGRPWYIDYQGGRRGALAYDLASLLLDAKANLPQPFREELAGVYLESASKELAERGGASDEEKAQLEPARFRGWLEAFSLIRLLQAMGAYGFRGFYERKTHFLQSVPYAIANLERLLAGWSGPRLPALFATLERLTRLTRLREIAPVTVPLTVRVASFSYKNGYPADASGHGGGHVFDCRCLPNPGREEAFRALTGRDAETIRWLERHEEVSEFLSHVRAVLHQSVQSYHRRNFAFLSVAFGCTGGQHRSVYCAEQTARWLRAQPHVAVEVEHRDMPR